MASYVKPQVGSVLEERYLLERVVGEGGMGVVYGARHMELGEIVAVKVLHPGEALDEEHLERFLREARLAAKIKNEHVVKVLDVARGRPGGSPPYIVMEYLDGLDLADLVSKRGVLSVPEAVDYILQACIALTEAHQHGIVHRDLKPSNLLVTQRSDGTPFVKVLDFGISKTHDQEDSKLTTTTAVFGSPAYMSPEQIRSAKHVDARSDVWALAVVMFELITGRLPFVGETASAILAGVSADPPLPLSQYAPHVPAGFQEAVEACLVKDRERRVASIPDFVALFAPFASPAGQSSVEAVRRIAAQARSSIPGTNSGAPPAFSNAPPAVPTPRRTAYATTEQDGAPVFAPAPSSGSVAAGAVGRTDRGIVVASRRSLKSRTSIVAGIGVAVLAAGLIVGTWAFQRARAAAAASTSSQSSWSDNTPPVSPTTSSSSSALASNPADHAPSTTPTIVASTTTSVSPRAASVPKNPPPLRGNAAGGAHGGGKHPHGAAPSVAPPPPSPPPAAAPPATPPATTTTGHVDTDSRQ